MDGTVGQFCVCSSYLLAMKLEVSSGDHQLLLDHLGRIEVVQAPFREARRAYAGARSSPGDTEPDLYEESSGFLQKSLLPLPTEERDESFRPLLKKSPASSVPNSL